MQSSLNYRSDVFLGMCVGGEVSTVSDKELEIPNFIQERNQTVQHGQPPPLSLTEGSLTFNFIPGKGSSGT